MKRVIVIGAGILGTSAAYHLAKAGAKVTIIDRQDLGQATDAAAGIVCPWLSQRRNKAWYTLAKEGAKYYSSLIKQLKDDGEKNTGYKKVGAISIHTEEEKLNKMEERAFMRREEAPEIGEISRLSKEKTKELFPPINTEFSSVHISGAARVNGRALCLALLNSAIKNGADFIHGDASIVYQDHKVTGVMVDGRSLSADTVIVTAGAWANELLKPLGINFLVSPQKAQIVHLRMPEADTGEFPVIMPPNNQYILAFDDNRIVIGATHEDNKGYDLSVTAGGLHEIFDKALAVASELNDCELIETRVGFRPFTPGFLPVIGPLLGYEGILIANGLGASGLTVGPFLGGQLAKLALGNELDIDLNDYNVQEAIAK
ncbi:FAD-binding oxidoreductase [Bacillus sp. S/N-304-OC-R1]|uniref:NAD(P)/FAD-dependent oxidoreductase n=1 Tax=Bacillus sp. S/N-304-OC-R1 TaxID=2758034 RepID=UPI001C8DAD96|nr:FAD-binding oxidoreductase [Bacillus sp. S/N-304-OC-R1]MBY0120473.1 FAD-binding oxidoreductase [Bacillus sp. S/N-304-OC-R1]